MRKLLLAGVASVLSVAGAYAAPIASDTTITNGGFTFSNFSCSPGGNNGATAGGCSGLNVVTNGASGIEFQGLLQALSAPNASPSSSAASSLDVLLSYQVTAPNPITNVSLAFNGAVDGDSIVKAQVVESAFATRGGTLLGTTQVQTPSPLQSSLTLSPGQTSLYLTKDVSVTARGGSSLTSASISFIDQTFGGSSGGSPGTPTPSPTPTPTPTPSAVPEPVSLALLGSGLVGLGLVRRAKRS